MKTREQKEADFVEKESKNPDVVAIYSSLWTSIMVEGRQNLAYTIVTRNPAQHTTPEQMIEDCKKRRDRLLFRRYFD